MGVQLENFSANDSGASLATPKSFSPHRVRPYPGVLELEDQSPTDRLPLHICGRVWLLFFVVSWAVVIGIGYGINELAKAYLPPISSMF